MQRINAQPGQYNTDADSLVTLKDVGVSDRVIAAMVNKSRKLLTSLHETPVVLAEVNDIGAYYKDRAGNWVPIEPEIVHIKLGGFIQATVTNGIIKQDRNGHINGRESKLQLQRPIQILLYSPEGVSASEYELLRLRLNSNSRELRTLTGGVFHTTGGEFGILPLGRGNLTNGGKIYAFAITE